MWVFFLLSFPFPPHAPPISFSILQDKDKRKRARQCSHFKRRINRNEKRGVQEIGLQLHKFKTGISYCTDYEVLDCSIRELDNLLCNAKCTYTSTVWI